MGKEQSQIKEEEALCADGGHSSGDEINEEYKNSNKNGSDVK
jgi:hypothetical protein